jgi:hypothetical protein
VATSAPDAGELPVPAAQHCAGHWARCRAIFNTVRWWRELKLRREESNRTARHWVECDCVLKGNCTSVRTHARTQSKNVWNGTRVTDKCLYLLHAFAWCIIRTSIHCETQTTDAFRHEQARHCRCSHKHGEHWVYRVRTLKYVHIILKCLIQLIRT